MLLRPRLSAAFAAMALVAIALVLAPAASASTSSIGREPVAYRLPYLAGQSYPVTQGWHDPYSHHGHSAFAYDFGLPMGTPVVAAAAGVVAFAASGHKGCGDETLKSAANFVTIYHADGTATLYAHLSKVTVHVGDVLTSGQVIGYSGKTGYTNCEPHLHFARQRQGKAVTQSIPIYFVESGHRRLRQGADVTSHNPVCAQGTTLPNGAFCGVYTRPSDLGALPFVRLDRKVRIGSVPASGARVPSRGPAAPTAASWIGRFTFAASGNYLFDVEADGVVHLSIDGEAVLDTSVDPAGTADPATTASLPVPGTSAAIGAALGAPAAPDPSLAPTTGLAVTIADGPAPGEHVVTAWLPSGQHVIQVVYQAGATSFLRFDWQQVDPDAVVRTLY